MKLLAESNKLAVTVHHNNEVTVRDERGYPNLCRDCRYSGWLTEWEWVKFPHPQTCLRYSGGADTIDGDRVIFDNVTGLHTNPYSNTTSRRQKEHNDCARQQRNTYPRCAKKNPDGNCEDFVQAKTLPWWGNLWRKLLRREWRARRMRL